MKLSRPIAWLLILLAASTAGILRQFNESTPSSPYFPPVVGSLLFAVVLVLLLVAARERRSKPVGGAGIRLGSLIPLLLMLFIEKWVSIALYDPVFFGFGLGETAPAVADARFRLFAGGGLILICLWVGSLSKPTARTVIRRLRLRSLPLAILGMVTVVIATYTLLGVLLHLRRPVELWWARPSGLWALVMVGQMSLAFGEELYYRGILLAEIYRLGPRLGLSGAPARRWSALLITSALFALEHVQLEGTPQDTIRRWTFTFSLGLLLGLIVLLSDSLFLAASLHAWINWLLLSAAPRLVGPDGAAAIEPGTYIGVALAMSFLWVLLTLKGRRPAVSASPTGGGPA